MTRHMWERLNIPVTGILHVFSHLSAGRCFYVPCAYCLPAKRSAGGLGTRMFNANQMLWIKFRENEVDLELDSRKRYPNFSVFVDLVWIVQSGGVRSLLNIFISLIITNNIWRPEPGFSLYQSNMERRMNLEQKFIFQIDTLNSHDINERFSFN